MNNLKIINNILENYSDDYLIIKDNSITFLKSNEYNIEYINSTNINISYHLKDNIQIKLFIMSKNNSIESNDTYTLEEKSSLLLFKLYHPKSNDLILKLST